MKSRKEIYQKLDEWQRTVELETGHNVIRYRCDNANEYQKFETTVQANGIHKEYTTPYTPEQNGVEGRYNRTIIQMVRGMLSWAELPHSFWGEAAMTANYLRNLLLVGHNRLHLPSNGVNGSLQSTICAHLDV